MGLGFTIPNEAQANANGYIEQADIDTVDYEILALGHAGYGVISGCQVTAQASPDMTVAVSAGVVLVGASQVQVPAQNSAAYAANGTNPRYAFVEINPTLNPGSRVVRNAGSPAAAPIFPSPTAGNVVLAAITIPANATSITNLQIVDKRIFIAVASSVGARQYLSTVDTIRSRP